MATLSLLDQGHTQGEVTLLLGLGRQETQVGLGRLVVMHPHHGHRPAAREVAVVGLARIGLCSARPVPWMFVKSLEVAVNALAHKADEGLGREAMAAHHALAARLWESQLMSPAMQRGLRQ